MYQVLECDQIYTPVFSYCPMLHSRSQNVQGDRGSLVPGQGESKCPSVPCWKRTNRCLWPSVHFEARARVENVRSILAFTPCPCCLSGLCMYRYLVFGKEIQGEPAVLRAHRKMADDGRSCSRTCNVEERMRSA